MNIPYASKRILIFYNFIPFINILFFLIFFQTFRINPLGRTKLLIAYHILCLERSVSHKYAHISL